MANNRRERRERRNQRAGNRFQSRRRESGPHARKGGHVHREARPFRGSGGSVAGPVAGSASPSTTPSAPLPLPTRALFGVEAKWWAVELRFARPLRPNEARKIGLALPRFDPSADREAGALDGGRDGWFWGQWPSKYPDGSDEELLRTAIRRIGVAAKYRAAPLGRDCTGFRCEWKQASILVFSCQVGTVEACDPVFCEADWIYFDPFAAPLNPAPKPGMNHGKILR